jgi:hypothetical protein
LRDKKTNQKKEREREKRGRVRERKMKGEGGSEREREIGEKNDRNSERMAEKQRWEERK